MPVSRRKRRHPARVLTSNGVQATKTCGNSGRSANREAGGPKVLRRFHGTVHLDATRLARDAGTVAEEVVQHLSVSSARTTRLQSKSKRRFPTVLQTT